MSAKLIKLIIVACSDPKYLRPTGEVFETLVNPDSYREDIRIQYNESQALGTSGASLKYRGTKPQKMQFDFLFDGTGTLPVSSIGTLAAKVIPVSAQIEWFKRVTLDYKGNIHSPRYLRIAWGRLNFKGKLIDLSVQYTLFKPNGVPLRAKATATFQESIEATHRVLKERASSPDLTHVRTVKAGDTLPLLSHEVYGDPSYYLKIARDNKLTNIRKLVPGEKLLIRPLS